MLESLASMLFDTGNAIVSTWIGVFVVWSGLLGLSRVFTQLRKIQGKKFKWSFFLRHEAVFSALNVGLTTIVLVTVSAFLTNRGILATDPSPTPWYIVVFEFALYFFIFDLYFYLFHRLIHYKPLYKWIHLTHHRSISPNPLSSSSMHPLEGIGEGLIIPIFLSLFTVHDTTLMIIIPFANIMGLYVHCGYEMMPRWWYKSGLTSWFITPMFHDQHHQYFNFNYGGFTTIWDRVFGTVRPQFYDDFDRLKAAELSLEKQSQIV